MQSVSNVPATAHSESAILEAQSLICFRKDGIRKCCMIRNSGFLQLFHCLAGHLQRFTPIHPHSETHS